MIRLTYGFFYVVFYLISLLPFSVLYLLSDVVFLLLYYIIRYRRRLVRKHLTTCFPEMSQADIIKTEKAFYHWMCDYFNETIKLLSIKPENLLKHIEFRNVEALEACFSDGQDCAAVLGHYCNWEWLSATGLCFKQHPEAVAGLIYHPLYNKAFDKLFLDIRQSMGGVCIPKKDILRYLVKYRGENRRSLFGYISDQGPKWENIHLWIDFLHHETPVFTGAERIMRKMKQAVFYVDMQRPKRGKYICTFQLITRNPQELEEHELTRIFFEMLEASIRKQPAYYLWTHNRWKRSKKEFDQHFRIENGRTVRITPTNQPHE